MVNALVNGDLLPEKNQYRNPNQKAGYFFFLFTEFMFFCLNANISP